MTTDSNSPNAAAGERCEHGCVPASSCYDLRCLRTQLATVREAHDETRRALALKDSYKAERDEYAKSATALRTALATEQAAHEATQRERDCERDKAAVNFASCERLKAERDRAEAALATTTERVRALETTMRDLLECAEKGPEGVGSNEYAYFLGEVRALLGMPAYDAVGRYQ
jgi:hypothetical protein